MSPEFEQIQLNFHLTSVYDHSLHEAFSRVLHKLIQSLPFLEELLNVFCAVSFDVSVGEFKFSSFIPEHSIAESLFVRHPLAIIRRHRRLTRRLSYTQLVLRLPSYAQFIRTLVQVSSLPSASLRNFAVICSDPF